MDAYIEKFGHVGIAGDEFRKDKLVASGATPCVRCGGTGNQLVSMHQACWLCNATGVADTIRALDVCEHGNTTDESCYKCEREGTALHYRGCKCPVASGEK